MPRKPRIHVPGAFYHVTLRGDHHQDIFFCDDDRLLMNRIVSDVIGQLGARVHAYCWTTNHAHLLIQVGELPLWRIMLRIVSRYARNIQKRLQTTGHLFESRYHAVLVDADKCLLTVIRYIHLNPLETMGMELDVYPWSSHHAYLGVRNEPWVTTEFALSMLHPTRERGSFMYKQLIGEPAIQSRQCYFYELNSIDRRFLGCDDFAASAQVMSWQLRSQKTLDQLVDEACKQYSMKREQLFDTRRSRQAAIARAWIAQQAVSLRIASISSVASLFGRDESTVRKSMTRYHEKR
jgi:putative transposase